MTVFYILLPIGLLLIVVGLGVGAYQHQSIKTGTIVEGTVVQNVRRSGSRSGRSYTPEIGFKTAQGRYQLFMPSFSSNPPAYNPGDKVRVVYQGDGESPRILSFGLRFGLAWSLTGAGIALVFIALGFRFGNDFVNSYYATSTLLFGR